MSKAQKAAEAMAEALHKNRPDGIEYVVFVIADQGDQFETVLAASLPPSMFAPVLRAWVQRYDDGEATEFKLDA